VQLKSGSTVTGWQYTNAANDSLETYDAYGNLSSIAYREGTVVTMAYATGTGATFPGQLLSVTDSFGRKITFGYAASVLHTMTDPNGGVYTYTLGPAGSDLLSSVTYPDTFSESYLYNESTYTGGLNLPTALTGVMDESNSRYTTTWYGTGGAATQTALAGGVGQYSMTNTLDGTGRIQSVALVDPLGGSRGRTFVSSVGRNRVATVTQPATNGSPAASKTYAYDANGNVAQVTDFNGNVQCAVYDLTRNLETGRVEGMAPGSTCPANIATYVPTAGTVQRKILTQWHSIWHLVTKRAEPLKITTWVYNGDGGVYCAPTTAQVGVNPIGVVCSRSEQATTDATGGSGFSATASGSPRVWSYTYNNFGQVLTADGPRTDVTDVTTLTYYTCTTGGKCGQIDTISNALGQVTTFLTYNGNGQPLTLSDPNGVVTTLTYDARLRLKSRQVGTETTSYTYYPTGLLNVVTLPDSSTVQFFYDAAHRLNKITDGLGNYISYTLDAMGNRTAENSYDPSATLHRTHSRVYNAVNELYQDINAANTAAVTTTLGYDGNGNVLTSSAPLARNTTNTYDALNRLSQITDPNSGVTKLAYDGRNNLASVIDPRTFSTSYTNDGFGDVAQLVSPDTGTSHKTYDSGGNLQTTTDARGALGTYSYDALNRLTKIVYTDQTIQYTYDVGTNGKGRLTGASDASHSMSWGYDTLGRVNSKSQTVAGVTKTVGYTYTNGDLTSLVTPSGQTVTYGYTNHRVTSIMVGSTTILSGVTYDPFGPATGWTWGNSSTTTHTFDTDGNPKQIVAAGVTNGYMIDNAFRITGISDSGLASNSWTFGYDLLDRVKTGSSGAKTRGYTYDADSNRLTTTGTTASTETIAPTNNHLSSTSGGIVRTYAYDNAGNTLSFTGETFNFNQRGRMSSATSSGGTTNYVYNALGQLIEKSGNGGTTLLVYDEGGHLLGEYSSTGALVQETVWMGNVPVATLRPNGSTACTLALCVFYVHTDHLGAPRKVTTSTSANSLMWRFDPDTFGSVAPNNNPSGLGTFVYNLRFPGQYSLTESGLYYNYHRDYDPATGRYIESDPIGLAGGINPYAYARGNPISLADALGLCPSAQSQAPTPQGQQQNDFVGAAGALVATTTFIGGVAGSVYAYGELPAAIAAYSSVGGEVALIGTAAAVSDVGALALVGASVGAAGGVVLAAPLGIGYGVGHKISPWVNRNIIDRLYGYY
jgi:RHS repeat-associated protein